jgi:hypothetical protein
MVPYMGESTQMNCAGFAKFDEDRADIGGDIEFEKASFAARKFKKLFIFVWSNQDDHIFMGQVIVMKEFYVVGGEYTDMSFTICKELETYGPFNSYEEAWSMWKGISMKHVDDCQRKYTIKEQ